MNKGNAWKGEWERVFAVVQDIGARHVTGCKVIQAYISIVGASFLADDEDLQFVIFI